jgi:hypothetical protein
MSNNSDDVMIPTPVVGDAFLPQVEVVVDATTTGTTQIGPCALEAACTAKDQELSEQYRCRFCNKQLHGFISGCSQAKNPKDFRDGVVCKEQPCSNLDNDITNEDDAAAVLLPGGLSDGVVSTVVWMNSLCGSCFVCFAI